MSDLARRWFSWKLNEDRIKRHLDRITPQSANCKTESRTIRAATVQRRVSPVKSIEQYIDMMEGFVKAAAERNCHIIVFPEYNFLDIFGIIPGFSRLNIYLNKKAVKPTVKNKTAGMDIGSLRPLLYSIAAPVQSAVEALMCSLASKYCIYIYTGSFFIKENEKLYNGGAVISREGKLLGRQKKLHLTDFEEKLGISRGNELEVFSLDIGNFAFPVCMDATYFETFSLARIQNCDVVALPIANNEEYGLYRALRGIWPRVQEAYVYGVKASMTGWFCGMHFTGKAGVFAPIGITPKGDGVVAVSEDFEGNSIVVGDISLEALYKGRAVDEYYGDCNPEFERDYYSNIYQGVK